MNWQHVSSELQAAVSEVRFEIKQATVLVPSHPVDLHKLLLEAAENESDLEEFTGFSSESNAGDALEVLESHWPCPTVISFEWDGLGPISSSLDLHSFKPGDGRTYVLPAWDERERLTAIAAIQPADDHEIWPAFFRSLLRENGADYGVELFGTLPSRTINDRPDLISADVVFQTYWHWMGWATRNLGADTWTALRDGVIGELFEPDHRARSLSILKRYPLGDPKRLQDYLQAREEEGSQLSPDERLLILTNYFGRAYKQKRYPRRKMSRRRPS